MKRELQMFLKKILCFALAFNILYTSVDFSAFSAWAAEERPLVGEDATVLTEDQDTEEENDGIMLLDAGEDGTSDGTPNPDENNTGNTTGPDEVEEVEPSGDAFEYAVEAVFDIKVKLEGDVADFLDLEKYVDDDHRGETDSEDTNHNIIIPINLRYGRENDSNYTPFLTEETNIVVNGNTGTISNVKLYVKKGTGNKQTTGGDGSYQIDANYYSIEILKHISTDNMFSYTFGSGHQSNVNITKDDNDLIFDANSAIPLKIVKRPVKELGINFHFIDDQKTTSIPEELREQFFAIQYHENGLTYRYSYAFGEEFHLTNSSFTATFRNMPLEINDTDYSVGLYLPNGYITQDKNGNKLSYNEYGHWNYYPYPDMKDIYFIKEKELKGQFLWLDSQGELGENSLRPDIDTIKSKLEVYQTNINNETTVLDPNNYIIELKQNATNANRWDLEIKGLPSFTKEGAVLNYYYKLKDDETISSKTPAEGSTESAYKYLVQYNNGTNSANTTQAYNGCTIYMTRTLEAERSFIHVQWKDDEYNNPDNEARKEEIKDGKVTLYLMRYPGNNPEKGAAVYDGDGNQYQYSLTEADIDDSNVIYLEDGTDGTTTFGIQKLEQYNENGVPYTYYVTAVLEGSGYALSYPEAHKYVLKDETLTLTRIGKEHKQATVVWKAGGENDYQGSQAELILQRRVLPASASGVQKPAWVTVENAFETTSAATNANKEVAGTFLNVDLYDAEGKTYEFRVIEKKVFNGQESADNIGITNGNVVWTENEEQNEASSEFTYFAHNYVVTSEYKKDDAGNEIYRITNLLHGDLDYRLTVTWDSETDKLSPEEKNAYINKVKSLLDKTGEPVSYIITRDGENYAKITVNPKNSDVDKYTYTVTYLIDSRESETHDLKGNTEADSTGNISWVFDQMVFPHYDVNGDKYSYGIKGEAYQDIDINEHGDIVSFLKDNLGDKVSLHIEKTQNDTNATVHHYLTSGGPSHYITVKVTWKDNITNIANRKVESRIVALKKIDDKYYLYKDLTENNDAIYLNASNKFEVLRYFTPLSKQEDFENANNAIDSDANLSEQEKANLKIEYSENAPGELIYAAVQYSISYGDTDYLIPYYDEETRKVNPAHLITGAKPQRTDLIPDEADPLKIKLYSYDLERIENNNFVQYDSENGDNETFTFLDSIDQIRTDIAFYINWQDDTNFSKYRKNGLKVVLLRSLDGSAYSSVLDTNQSKYEVVFDTTDASEITNNAYYYDPTKEGQFEFSSNMKNPVQIEWKDLPLFNENGQSYNYKIAQYIIGDNNEEILIRENTSVADDNSHYASHSQKVVTVQEGDSYKQLLTFRINNEAINPHYSTRFYILWHDEAAYKEKVRPDMKYTLYYSIGDSTEKIPYDNRTEYTSVIKTAEESITGLVNQNPYYQQVEYKGLAEFYQYKAGDEELFNTIATPNDMKSLEGKKIHYYLKETLADTNADAFYEYKISYYDFDNSDKNNGENGVKKESKHVKDGIMGVLFPYSQRYIPDNILAKGTYAKDKSNNVYEESGDCLIAENHVLVNSIHAVINVAGTKKWVNMSDEAEKPECTVFLYQESDYETSKKFPANGEPDEEDAESYVDKTRLDEGDASYHFYKQDSTPELKDYPKYDKYGAVYTYSIAELIKGDDGYKIETFIMTGHSESNQVLVNTFDPNGQNSRNITINKTWNLQGVTGLKNPVAKFYVYRMIYSGKIDGRNPAAKNVPYDSIYSDIINGKRDGVSWKNYFSTKTEFELVSTKYITKDSGSNSKSTTVDKLNIYAPNGKSYVYFVLEDEDYAKSYTVTNTALVRSNDGNWTDNDNTVEVSGSKDKGFSLDNTVIMVSNEKVGLEADAINKNTVAFQNTLQTDKVITKITGTVQWVEGDTNIRDIARPWTTESQHGYSTIDVAAKDVIKLRLSRTATTQTELDKESQNNITSYYCEFTDNNGKYTNNWKSQSGEYVIPEEKIVWTYDNARDLWQYEITFDEPIPMYAENGNPYTYSITESFYGGEDHKNGQITSYNYTISPATRSGVADSATKETTVDNVDIYTLAMKNHIINTLGGTYTVQKTWNDGYDSYVLRPKKVLMMYQYQLPGESTWHILTYHSKHAKKGKAVTVEVTKASSWKASLQRFPLQALSDVGDDKYYRYRVVEIGFAYEGEKDATGKVLNYTWTPTTDISLAGYTTESGLSIDDSIKDDWNYPTSGLYKYEEKSHGFYNSDRNNIFQSSLTFGSYTVFPGDGKPDGTNGFIFNDEKAHTTKIRNYLDQSTTLTVTKIWDDQNNSFNVRKPITIQLERAICRHVKLDDNNNVVTDDSGQIQYNEDNPISYSVLLNQQDVWQPVSKLVLTASDSNTNVWEKVFNDIPVFDQDGNKLVYRAFECGTDANGELVAIKSDDNNYKVGSYELSSFSNEANDDATQFYFECTNQLVYDQGIGNITLNKQWNIDGGNTTAKTSNYTATVIVNAHYKGTFHYSDTETESVSTTLTSKQVLNSGNDFSVQLAKSVPSYFTKEVKKSKEVTNNQGETKTEEFTDTVYFTLDQANPITVKESAVNLTGAGEDTSVDYVDDQGKEYQTYGSNTVGKYNAIYKENNTTWITETTKSADSHTYTITNTPLTSHTLVVNYIGDNGEGNGGNADFSQQEKYHTRPNEVKVKLQYRVKAASDAESANWNNVDTDFYNHLLNTVAVNNISVVSTGMTTIGEDTTTLGDTYEVSVDDLPRYITIDGEAKELEYRIIETAANYTTEDNYVATAASFNDLYTTDTSKTPGLSLNPVVNDATEGTYGKDKSVAGYTYTYNDQDTTGEKADTATTTYLTKELLKVKVNGTKVWDDENDKYSMRPTAPDTVGKVQNNDNKVKVSVYKGTQSTAEDVSITWKNHSDADKWTYETAAVLPKYATGSQKLETYTAAETVTSDVSNVYNTVYGENQNSAELDVANTVKNGNGQAYRLSDITNTIKTNDLAIRKVWEGVSKYNDLGITPVSVTYTVQKSSDGGTTYSDLEQRDVGNSSSKKPVTVTLSYTAPTDGSSTFISNATIEKLPTHDVNGNQFTYRILETELKVELKKYNAIDSDSPIEVTYTLEKESDSDSYNVYEKVTNQTKVKKNTVSNLSGDTFSYGFGPFNATYKVVTENDITTHSFTNTPRYASAIANIQWEEKKTDGAENDATLTKNFRPDSTQFVLQKRVGDTGVWTTVTTDDPISIATKTQKDNAYEGSFVIATTDAKSDELPLFCVSSDGSSVVNYEYRIVEKQFTYDVNKGGATAESVRELNYKQEGQTDITSDFVTDSNNKPALYCTDKTSDEKTFYKGEQSNTKEENNAGITYKTTIVNKLQTEELVKQVFTKLTGTVTWLDNKNELGKRPDGTAKGLSMVLRATDAAGKVIASSEFKLGNTNKGVDSESIPVDTLIRDSKDDATSTAQADLSWTKDETNGTWSYTFEGLPLYDLKGNYITYSIYHKENATDYDGLAQDGKVGGAESQTRKVENDTNSRPTYAFGTPAIDIINDYSDEGKLIEHVDFVETMTTTLTVIKKWENETAGSYWQTRPNDLYVVLQYRLVSKNADGSINSTSEWKNIGDGEYSPGTTLPTAESWSEEFDSGFVVNTPQTFYTLRKEDGDNEKKKEWQYEATLPQYKVVGDQYDLVQYRVCEIAKAAIGENKGNYIILTEADLEVTGEGKKKYQNYDQYPHIGSYYMTKYNGDNWDTGHSKTEIENTYDTRQDITVKKEWNSSVIDADKKNVKVKLVGTSSNATGNVSTVETVFEKVLSSDIGWAFTYKALPEYNLNFEKVTWHLEEISVDGQTAHDVTILNSDASKNRIAATEDSKWIGIYKEEEKTEDQNKELIFTVTNIPATSAKLTAKYEDDFSNDYQTRFENTKAVLQYRVKGNDENNWANVTNTTENNNLANQIIQEATVSGHKYTTGTVSLVDSLGVVIEQSNPDLEDTYSYEIKNLPKYISDQSTDELEYRIIEIGQKDLEVIYSNSADTTDIKNISLSKDKEASGGYTYDYSATTEQADAKLTKKLLKTTLTGSKIWVDAGNAYGTRPVQAGDQTADSLVKIAITEATMQELKQPTITWALAQVNSPNTWTYKTSDLPKYQSQKDILAAYTITEKTYVSRNKTVMNGEETEIVPETVEDPRYAVSYGTGKSASTIETTTNDDANRGNIISQMTDITNTLSSVDYTATKIWRNDAKAAAFDATFKLQSKLSGETEYKDVPSSYLSKILVQNTTSYNDKVEWLGLPDKDVYGNTITYRIVEVLPANVTNYIIEQDESVTNGNMTSTTFYNIELQDYTVEKQWIDIVKGICCTDDGNYIAEGVLEQKVGESGTFATYQIKDTTDALVDATWKVSNTFEQIKNPDASTNLTYTFQNLPKYKKDGTKLFYQAEETKINETEGGLENYKTEYVHETSGTKTTVKNTLKDVIIHIMKKDATSKEGMAGVEFGLFETGQSEQPTYRATSDTDGNVYFHVLAPAELTLKEISNPSGYKRYTENQTISVTEAHFNHTAFIEPITIENVRMLGEIIIYKKDGDTDASLDGVVFALYQKNETKNIIEKIWNFITGKTYEKINETAVDSRGTTTIKNIPWGEYYIVEEEANTGYKLTTNSYYFKVGPETLGTENAPKTLELYSSNTYASDGKITDNTLTNYKNKFSFRKQSVNGDVLHSGTYAIYRVKDDNTKVLVDIQGNETPVVATSFTIPENADSVIFEGFPVGDYVIHEVQQPDYYDLAEDVPFTITATGEIKKSASGPDWENETVKMQDMPLCSFTVTKVFDDETWKYSLRPKEVKLQLYNRVEGSSDEIPVGYPTIIAVNKNEGTYTHTYENLPMYQLVGDTYKKLTYSVKELDADSIYTVTEDIVLCTNVDGTTVEGKPGCKYTQTIENKIARNPVQTIYISKENIDGPPAAEFNVVVTFHKGDDGTVFTYSGDYEVGKLASNNTFELNDTKQTDANGILKIKDGDTLRITLPTGVAFEVDEILSNLASDPNSPVFEYDKEIDKKSEFNNDENTTLVAITNTKKVYTSINNETINHLDKVVEKPTNAGGKVAVIEKNNQQDKVVDKEDHSNSGYKEGKYGVTWYPAEDWRLGNSFTVTYKENLGASDGGQVKKLTVEGYLDEEGKLILKKDENGKLNPCYQELASRYENFEIDKKDTDGDGIPEQIYLYLADTVRGMPVLNEVNVIFHPTIAVANTTEERIGGAVKVEGGVFQTDSDGMQENEDDRYVNQTTIYAQADDGYQVDLESFQIGLVGTILESINSQGSNPGNSEDKESGPTAKAIFEDTFKDLLQAEAEKSKLTGKHILAASLLPSPADAMDIVPIVFQNGRFEATLGYKMAGEDSAYTLTGALAITQRDGYGNPKGIALTLDKLSIPVDIGVAFKKVVPPPVVNGGESEDSTSDAFLANVKNGIPIGSKDKAPKTGDPNTLYTWYLIFLLALGSSFALLHEIREDRKRNKHMQ